MQNIKSTYFTTLSGSNTLAMLASFCEGRKILFDIVRTEQLAVNLMSYVRKDDNNKVQTENALIVLLNDEETEDTSEDDLFRLLLNRMLLFSKTSGAGSFSAITDTVLHLQECGNRDLLLESSQKLSFLQIKREDLAIHWSEIGEESFAPTVEEIMRSDFVHMQAYSSREQIPKYTNYWFLKGWLSYIAYWWSAYITYGLDLTLKKEWENSRFRVWLSFFKQKHERAAKKLFTLCVVPLYYFNSYSDFSEDRDPTFTNKNLGNSWILRVWNYLQQKLHDLNIIYLPAEKDHVMPYRPTSAFLKAMTNQHENDIFHQGDTIFELLLQYKWKTFARNRFFLVYSIHITYYISYSVGVLFAREVFDYTLGSSIIYDSGHLACISLMFISGGILLIQEIHQLAKSGSKFQYISSPYNFVDIAAFVLPVVGFWQILYYKPGIVSCYREEFIVNNVLMCVYI